ncbi:DNA mismatch repair endonuclease MutL [Halorientalis brevis]|uniref:DNA mismatch repair protein MutL n=1 Tax=Halorientalis brevis TaxID=1126241 RepID=A0ABD6CD23_9EURY|nr:DNA mismatch repair endonuclease MutL [Halorientalis brevis]
MSEGSIRELDPKTVERIAAGEVVERPASVVKELVENSLDADASRVEVAVQRGGKDGIRVTDDGIGMSEDEVRRAVEKHTTSKIRDIEDLESGVATLGFRGEALHAIGAVSRLTIKTRPRGGDTGTELRVEGGDVAEVKPAGCPEGTTIEVEDLFYNVPARRKYLKQDGTEFAHVNDVVTSYALANPDVRVSLTHDDRETFATTGQGDLQSTVMSVYGREVAKGMVEVDPDESDENDSNLPDGPLESVSGLVSHPETTRASNDYVTTYVNGRYVRSGTVRDAIVDAYGNQLAPDRYPFAVFFLELPADTVDVNVHPRKMEVRFADSDGVREQVQTAVEEALLREGIVRSSAPRGRSAPAQAEIVPERSDDAEGDAETAGTAGTADAPEADRPDEPTDAASTEPAPTDPPTRQQDPIGPDDIRETSGVSAANGGDVADPAEASSGETEVSDASPQADPGVEERADGSAVDRPSTSPPSTDGPASQSSDTRQSEAAESSGTESSHEQAGRFRPGSAQTRLGTDDQAAVGGDTEAFDRLPAMRVLGQIHDTYVVAETDDGVVLIDQHAADERVNYERLRERFAGETATQALANPVDLSVTAREAELFTEYEDALARLGFQAERVDDRTVEVRTVPDLVAEAAGPELVREVLSAFVTGEAAAAETVDAVADELISDLACYPSITGNTSLTEGSVLALLEALDDCENPWACPHGRPVLIELDREEIESRFERDYPGHGG